MAQCVRKGIRRPHKPLKLRAYYQNVRWLKFKLLTFRTNLYLLDQINLVALTETNLDESIYDTEICDSGEWSVLRRDRVARSGGGVLLASRSPIHLERMPCYETAHCEDIWARFKLGECYVYVNVVYIYVTVRC